VGTLNDYAPEQVLDYVYAKSGSLNNNHVLAGFIFSAYKKNYTFVISVNNYTGDKQAVQDAIGAQLSIIYNKLVY